MNIAFNQPFAEQAEYFRKKLNLPTKAYDDITGAAHDHAFVVAGAMQADLLADLRGAVDKAIIEGKGLTAFRKEFKEIVAKSGWAHTGTAAWRSKVIFQTNLRTSHAAGRWAQLTKPSTVKARPFWRYVHSDYVLDPRPLHQAWDGLILAWDDPWWTTHFPPNGWGCQCTIQAIAADELASYGKTQADNPPTDAWDTRGIDEGWDYAPGQSATEAARIAKFKVTDIAPRDTAIARSYVATLMQQEGFAVWHDQIAAQVARLKPTVAKLPEADAIKALRKEVADQGAWPAAVLTTEAQEWLGTQTNTVAISTETLAKQAYKHPDVLLSDYRGLQNLLDQAQLVIQDTNGLHLVFFRQGDRLMQAVIKVTQDKREIYLQSLHQAELRKIASAKKKGRVVRDLLEEL